MKCGRILSFAPTSDLHNFFHTKPSQNQISKVSNIEFPKWNLAKPWKKSMVFQGETKKWYPVWSRGGFFPHRGFFLRSGYLEYAGRRFSVEDLIQMRAVTCDLCHRPIQEEIFSAKHKLHETLGIFRWTVTYCSFHYFCLLAFSQPHQEEHVFLSTFFNSTFPKTPSKLSSLLCLCWLFVVCWSFFAVTCLSFASCFFVYTVFFLGSSMIKTFAKSFSTGFWVDLVWDWHVQLLSGETLDLLLGLVFCWGLLVVTLKHPSPSFLVTPDTGRRTCSPSNYWTWV